MVPSPLAPGVEPARLEITSGAATILRGPAGTVPAPSPPTGTDTVWITDDDLVAVPSDPEALVGRDLFGWGTFEDVEADARLAYGTRWRLPHDGPVTIRPVAEAPSGVAYLELDARASVASGVVVRPVARVTLSLHRRYDDNGRPADAAARFSVEAVVRVEGDGRPFVRLDGYEFIDTVPTEEPESTLLTQLELPLDVPADGTWHQVRVDLRADVLQAPGGTVNTIMLYVGVSAPIADRTIAGFDNVAFVEWRPATSYPPDAAVAADVIRTTPPG